MNKKHFAMSCFFVLCMLSVMLLFSEDALARHKFLEEGDTQKVQQVENELVADRDEAMLIVPEITADAAILVNMDTGDVVYEKNADKVMYPASLTKIMTAIVVLENTSFDDVVTVSPYAADVETTRMRAGYKMRKFDMLQDMLMVSDNAIATALAEHTGGSEWGFTAMMNAKAQELGAISTNFVNANGMPDVRHVTTARDFARIASYAMKNRTFRRMVGAVEKHISYVYPAGRVDWFENTNDLLTTYPGCIGIKTGYTRAAGACLAAAARRGDVELLVIVLHAPDDETRFAEAARLLDYGFEFVR